MFKDLPEGQTHSVDEDSLILLAANQFGEDMVKKYSDVCQQLSAANKRIAELETQLSDAHKANELVVFATEQKLAGLEALMREKDDALVRIRKSCDTHLSYQEEAIVKWCDEALSHTSPTDALDRYKQKVLLDAFTNEYSAQQSRMAKGE